MLIAVLFLRQAHNIKNRLAKTSKACCALKSQYRWWSVSPIASDPTK